MHICIYCALVGLEIKLYKIQGTYIKYIDFTVIENLHTFAFILFT